MNKNNLKRMVIISIMMIVSIVYASVKRTDRNIGDAVQVTTLPVSGKVVILDAGHGTPDERCRKQKWNNRSANQFRDCTKNTTTFRTVRMYGDSYKVR